MRLAKHVALAALMIASTAGVTEAAIITVEYYTTGVFSDTGTNSIGNASTAVEISFTGVGTPGTPISVLSPDSPLFQNLGNFTVSRENNESQFNLDDSFTLSIFQSLPTVGNDTLVGALEGKIKQGDGKIVFSATTLTIGVVTYTLTSDEVLFIDPAKNSQTFTALNGNITHADDVVVDPTIITPEPTTLALLEVSAH